MQDPRWYHNRRALCYCPLLRELSIHFQLASLDPPHIPEFPLIGEPTTLQKDCALTALYVGEIPMPEPSALIVALTLIRIFPHLNRVEYTDDEWAEVADAIDNSKLSSIAQVRDIDYLPLERDC